MIRWVRSLFNDGRAQLVNMFIATADLFRAISTGICCLEVLMVFGVRAQSFEDFLPVEVLKPRQSGDDHLGFFYPDLDDNPFLQKKDRIQPRLLLAPDLPGEERADWIRMAIS
jgi:hypothetical protein